MSSGALQSINPKAEIVRRGHTLAFNMMAARGLSDVLRSNYGPAGTQKMLVSGAGDIKITKDGATLLSEMQIQHPTASLIARTATAQDDIAGDGTTAAILLISEVLNQAEAYILREGTHPRVITDGIEHAKNSVLQFIKTCKIPIEPIYDELIKVARTSLRTKLHPRLADSLADIVTNAVMTIHQEGKAIDLHMVEIMAMPSGRDMDTQLIRGLVLDHGSRTAGRSAKSKNVHILTMNVSLEYEKTEDSSTMTYNNPEQRAQLAAAERQFVEERVNKIIELKKQVIGDSEESFMVINQKGIDGPSLSALTDNGIVALRRAKRRNMERIKLACGGQAVNSLDDLSADVLGFAGSVWEEELGDDKFTFIDEVHDPHSCTILIKGPNKHTIVQIKDAVRDGLRAVKNAITDGCIVAGAGGIEVEMHNHLMREYKKVEGPMKVGVQVFADTLLVLPKTLAKNAGFGIQETTIALLEAYGDGTKDGKPVHVGLNLETGKPMNPVEMGVVDNYNVKVQLVQSAAVISSQLLLVDEVLKAGRALSKDQ
ncbi:Chaperonin Cpn60/TCP-1 [Carpediemonas membranifera]|uniref:Chaperonin Cpn60/TCP-1 n=1 Tax=Carpediemonas membranifera TaxID=201153 RepID=A0A8J6DYA1_9EUKA|nr:Chaperonin Cpn60/TCP-1 [Carpediemonas membranifera]|eukprot:KAG9391839.1 Chaperonin Cpn60/TCP-1 [Carpediemonas membranifera]